MSADTQCYRVYRWHTWQLLWSQSLVWVSMIWDVPLGMNSYRHGGLEKMNSAGIQREVTWQRGSGNWPYFSCSPKHMAREAGGGAEMHWGSALQSGNRGDAQTLLFCSALVRVLYTYKTKQNENVNSLSLFSTSWLKDQKCSLCLL